MKKVVLVFSLILTATFSVNAQKVSENAIGIRLGFGGEISYQKSLGDNNRLEIDLGLANDLNDFKATALYQWVWSLENKFNWYAGVGGGIVSANETGVFGSGVLGIEYNFESPILISIDYRPEIGISGGLSGLNSDVALSLRYQF